MSFLDRLLGIGPEGRAAITPDAFGRGLDLLPGGTAAGKRVGDKEALTLSPVYGSVRILSEGVATLEPYVTKGDLGPSGAIDASLPRWVDNPSLYDPHFGWVDFSSQVMVSLLLRGNAYVLTARDQSMKVQGLWVLDPDKVKIERDSLGRVFYVVTPEMGSPQELTPFDLLHIRGMLMPDSLYGMAPLEYAKETVGLGLSAQEFGARFFGNGANPSGLIETDGQLSREAVSLMRRTWNEMHQGSGNAQKVAVLTEGASFKPLSVPPEQAQFLATRGFQVADIARFFGVPPHLLGDSTGSTSWGSGLKEQTTNYVTHSLRPWVVRIEEAFTRLLQSERMSVASRSQRLHFHLNVESQLRGDWQTRISTYGSALDRGIYSINEVRAMEKLPSIGPEGDDHRVPLNTAPTDQEPSDFETPTEPPIEEGSDDDQPD